jgi:bifunctional DNase/RNase
VASPLPPPSDAELVAASRAGDMEAFACLVGRHQALVVAMARRLLGADDPVADVTQEATACIGDDKEVPRMTAATEPAWVDAEVIDVCRADGADDPLRRPHIVVLRERDGTRRLPMYTGAAEAVALACSLAATEMPRPMTYQLAANLLTAAGSRLTEVRITRLTEGVFYAVVVVEGPGGAVEVDARPSDALNLAVVSGAPVRVNAAVLSDPQVDAHPEWEQYPARMPDLAAEERQRRTAFLAPRDPEDEAAQ